MPRKRLYLYLLHCNSPFPRRCPRVEVSRVMFQKDLSGMEYKTCKAPFSRTEERLRIYCYTNHTFGKGRISCTRRHCWFAYASFNFKESGTTRLLLTKAYRTFSNPTRGFHTNAVYSRICQKLYCPKTSDFPVKIFPFSAAVVDFFRVICRKISSRPV